MKNLFTKIGFIIALAFMLGASSLAATSLVSDTNITIDSTSVDQSNYAESLKYVQTSLQKSDGLVKQLIDIKYNDAGNKLTIDKMLKTSKSIVSGMVTIVNATYNSNPSMIRKLNALEVENIKLNKYLGLDKIVTSRVKIANIEAIERKVALMKMNGVSISEANAQRQISVIIGTKLGEDGKIINDIITLPYVYSRGLDDKPGSIYFFVLYKQLDGKISLGEIEYTKGSSDASLVWKTGFTTVYNYAKFYNVCEDGLAKIKALEKADCKKQRNSVVRTDFPKCCKK